MNNLQVIENNDQRVLTTAQIAEEYGTTERRISENFNANKEHYVEGKHYYCLTGEEKRDFLNRTEIPYGSRATNFYLWTEKGALLHAKSLNTDKAWEAYEFLVDTYFAVKEKKQLTPIEMIASIANNAVETERRLNLAESKLNDMQTSIDNTSSKLNQALDVFTETFAVPDWSSCMNRRISAVIKQNGLNHQTERGNLYKELENLARCNLNVRKANKQKRMKKSGAKYKDIQAVSKLDVISDDAKLRAIFDGIVRKFEARYIQGDNVQMGIPEVIE